MCLASELGLYGLHRQAVALLPTVATALAHALVDEYPKRWLGDLVAFAQTALLGSAQLIVDQHRDTRNRCQPFLRLDHSGAVPDLNFVGQSNRVVPVKVVGSHQHGAHALQQQDACHRGHVDCASCVLPAGHRHNTVHQDLVGDVDASSDRTSNSQLAAVRVGAVADVLNEMRRIDKRSHAHPLGSFVTHTGEPDNFANA